jgi:hypothetical protein
MWRPHLDRRAACRLNLLICCSAIELRQNIADIIVASETNNTADSTNRTVESGQQGSKLRRRTSKDHETRRSEDRRKRARTSWDDDYLQFEKEMQDLSRDRYFLDFCYG